MPGAAVSLGLSTDTALGPGRGSIWPQQTVSVPSCSLHPRFLSKCHQGAPGACSLHSPFTRPFTHWRDPMTPGGFACAGPACGKAEVTELLAPGPTGWCEVRMWTPFVVPFILLPSVVENCLEGWPPWGDLGRLPGGGDAKLDLSFLLPLPFVPKGLLRRCPPPPLAFVSSVPSSPQDIPPRRFTVLLELLPLAGKPLINLVGRAPPAPPAPECCASRSGRCEIEGASEGTGGRPGPSLTLSGLRDDLRDAACPGLGRSCALWVPCLGRQGRRGDSPWQSDC